MDEINVDRELQLNQFIKELDLENNEIYYLCINDYIHYTMQKINENIWDYKFNYQCNFICCCICQRHKSMVQA